MVLAGLVLTIAITGGGRIDLAGAHLSMTRLYTPVLLLTVASASRAWMQWHGRISLVFPSALPPVRVIAVAGVVCLAAPSRPILFAVGSQVGERHWINPIIFWRSSAAGLDLLAFIAPNPFHPWFGAPFQDWLRQLSHTYIENAASIPWTVIALVVVAFAYVRASAPRYWIAFTAFFALLSLGPFVDAAGVNLYIPTPWALLRYLPIVGAARMPTRLAAVVMFGVAMLAAFAVKELRLRASRPGLLAAAVSAVLVFELLPAPRGVHDAGVPASTGWWPRIRVRLSC